MKQNLLKLRTMATFTAAVATLSFVTFSAVAQPCPLFPIYTHKLTVKVTDVSGIFDWGSSEQFIEINALPIAFHAKVEHHSTAITTQNVSAVSTNVKDYIFHGQHGTIHCILFHGRSKIPTDVKKIDIHVWNDIPGPGMQSANETCIDGTGCCEIMSAS